MMSKDSLSIKTKIQVAKPSTDVFEAIVNPEKMCSYFLAEGSQRMEANTTVTWKFPEFDEDVPVKIQQIEPQRYISFNWANDSTNEDSLVEIFIEPVNENASVITITEKCMPNNEAGLKWLAGNTEGWANFLASLKAYLEYGINLRNGAFDFMKLPS